MMSSCCTFRLKRRRAFSSDSPSCNLTSANETTPPNRSCGTRQLLQDGHIKSRTIWNFCHFLPQNKTCQSNSESQAQCKLQLTRSIRVSGVHEIGWNLIISREVVDSNLLSAVIEGGCIAQRAIVSELKTAVQPIKKVE